MTFLLLVVAPGLAMAAAADEPPPAVPSVDPSSAVPEPTPPSGASGADATATDGSPFNQPPPMAPFKRGPFTEGTFGVYAPTGRIKVLSAPGPWARLAVGFDFAKWLGVYGAFDAAFLDTNRGSPPPGPRSYVLWGLGFGARLSVGLGQHFRIPLRVDVGWHKTDDNGVLATYGFSEAANFGVSFGGATGLEWRAPTRHFGVSAEIGVRNDSSLVHFTKGGAPLGILGALVVRYTL